jgi:hypothetical protein
MLHLSRHGAENIIFRRVTNNRRCDFEITYDGEKVSGTGERLRLYENGEPISFNVLEGTEVTYEEGTNELGTEMMKINDVTDVDVRYDAFDDSEWLEVIVRRDEKEPIEITLFYPEQN